MPLDPATGEHDLATLLTLEVLFRTEADFVMNTARRCGLSDADAEDVTQQVFIILQRRLHTLHSPESIRPWLMTVTRRHAQVRLTAGRRDLTNHLPDDLGEVEDDGPLPEEQVLVSERRLELLDLLETIEPARRSVLVMHVLDDLPMVDVADALRIPVATAYNRLRLARHDLRVAFSRRNVAEEHAMVVRAWDKLCTVRDPSDVLYGRTIIVQSVRDRIWASVLERIVRDHVSIDAAERSGLRVMSPIWKANAPPRPYGRPRRPRKLAKSQHMALPPLPPTGFHTP